MPRFWCFLVIFFLSPLFLKLAVNLMLIYVECQYVFCSREFREGLFFFFFSFWVYELSSSSTRQNLWFRSRTMLFLFCFHNRRFKQLPTVSLTRFAYDFPTIKHNFVFFRVILWRRHNEKKKNSVIDDLKAMKSHILSLLELTFDI